MCWFRIRDLLPLQEQTHSGGHGVKKNTKQQKAIEVSELLTEFQRDRQLFIESEKDKDRVTAADNLLNAWDKLRQVAQASPINANKLPTMDHLSSQLESGLAQADPNKRQEAIQDISASFEQITNTISTLDTPADPALRWKPRGEILSEQQKQERLTKVAAQSKGTARTLAEAVRKIVANRRQQGVPLYSTYNNEASAAYSMLATEYTMGLINQVPATSPGTKRTTPWGIFRVRSKVAPLEAVQKFTASPPLPSRVELLQSRLAKIRLGPLHAAAGQGVNNNAERNSNQGDNDA